MEGRCCQANDSPMQIPSSLLSSTYSETTTYELIIKEYYRTRNRECHLKTTGEFAPRSRMRMRNIHLLRSRRFVVVELAQTKSRREMHAPQLARSSCPREDKKMAPLLGPYFKEARRGGTSGKRMQGTTLRHRAECRELSRTLEESEGHWILRPL